MQQKQLKSNVIQIGMDIPEHIEDINKLTATELSVKYKRTYSSHKNMKQRAKQGLCIVHPELREFKGFLRLVLPNPSDIGEPEGYTLDRIDPHDKEYAAKKVRWATKTEQANNKTNTETYTYDGITQNLTAWAKKVGRSRQALKKRLEQGLPLAIVFSYNLPNKQDMTGHYEWKKLPLHPHASIEKLEELYRSNKRIHLNGRTIINETRVVWLYYHIVGMSFDMATTLAEEYNPYTEGFDKEMHRLMNKNIDVLGVYINKLRLSIDSDTLKAMSGVSRGVPIAAVVKAFFIG